MSRTPIKGVPKSVKSLVGLLVIAGIGATVSGGLIEDVTEGKIAVRQIPVTGTVDVQSEPGYMWQLWGPVTYYNKAGTYDFSGNHTEDTLSGSAIKVQFNDGATAKYSGKCRFRLPTDPASMETIHRDFNRGSGDVSYRHLANSLIKDHIDECMRMTAALMASQEAYQSKKSEFSEWANDQLENGIYLTDAVEVDTQDGESEDRQRIVVRRRIGEDGQVIRKTSPLKQYGIEIISFTLGQEPTFDDKTMEQIETARSIFLRRLEARAEAETAQQEKITAKASGESAVETTKYQMLVEKERALIAAEQEAEVAVINAEREVDVAAQRKLEAEQIKLKAEVTANQAAEILLIDAEAQRAARELDKAAAEFEKAAAIARGEGEAEARRLVFEADNALTLRLNTELAIQSEWANAFSAYRGAIVPGITMGGGAEGETPNGLEMLMKLMAVRQAEITEQNMNRGSSDRIK